MSFASDPAVAVYTVNVIRDSASCPWLVLCIGVHSEYSPPKGRILVCTDRFGLPVTDLSWDLINLWDIYT